MVQHVHDRRAGGAGPATVINDLIWIGVVLRAAKSVQQMKLNPAIVDEARTACRELRLISKPRRRDRRVTPLEAKALVGDLLIITAYCGYDEEELQVYQPTIVLVDERNRPKTLSET